MGYNISTATTLACPWVLVSLKPSLVKYILSLLFLLIFFRTLFQWNLIHQLHNWIIHPEHHQEFQTWATWICNIIRSYFHKISFNFRLTVHSDRKNWWNLLNHPGQKANLCQHKYNKHVLHFLKHRLYYRKQLSCRNNKPLMHKFENL